MVEQSKLTSIHLFGFMLNDMAYWEKYRIGQCTQLANETKFLLVKNSPTVLTQELGRLPDSSLSLSPSLPLPSPLSLSLSLTHTLTPHPSPLTPHPSPLTPHPSPLTPHPSPLTPNPHPSPLTPHPSPLRSISPPRRAAPTSMPVISGLNSGQMNAFPA